MRFPDNIDIAEIISIAKEAGKEILKVYRKDFAVEYKEKNSPVTEADLNANLVIIKRLKILFPDIPMLSEESREVPYEERKSWEYFWMIDPLDGTKEFVKKNDEFTVNIALIHKGKPVLGVVYIPIGDIVYYSAGKGSFKIEGGQTKKLEPAKSKKTVIIASRSHISKETEEFIEEQKKKGKVDLIHSGSSKKLCLVAEGKADIYPRFAPTMEWDTAAAHAVVNGAGRKVLKYNSDEELQYNKEDLLNPWFIVK